MQGHTALAETVEKLSDESSYRPLFHSYKGEEALPSGEALKEVVELCRAVLFPGYFGNARISRQTIRYHTGVNVETLHALLTDQIYAGLCFADATCCDPSEDEFADKAEALSEAFIATLPELRRLLTTDVEATFNNDPTARNTAEVILCYPGIRAIMSYRIAHEMYVLDIPFIPRMISEMAHSETGIDIHPGARIGHHFAIYHGTGTVIDATSVIAPGATISQLKVES